MSSTDALLKVYYGITVPMTSKGIDCRQVDIRLRYLDLDKSGRIKDHEVWEYTTSTSAREEAVKKLIYQLNDSSKNLELKVDIIAALARLGTKTANDAIIKMSQSACADKIQLACIDAIGKMDYELARINLQRIRDQYGPLKIDIAPATRRRASLALLKLDIARSRKVKSNGAKAQQTEQLLEPLRFSLSSVSYPLYMKDRRQVSDDDIARLKSALHFLGRLSSEQMRSKDRGCVIRAIDVLRNDYSYPCTWSRHLDCSTVMLLQSEFKLFY